LPLAPHRLLDDLRFLGSLAASNLGGPRLPFKLTLILTYRCQLRCSMCSIWEREPEGELSKEEIRTFFRRNPSLRWINVSGGEIFLRPDIEEVLVSILEECRGLALLDFPTNGYQTRRILETVDALLRRRPRRLLVTVSVDGPRAVHDRIRGIEGSYDHAIETFGRLRTRRRRGFRPFLGLTLQPQNVDLVDTTIEAVRKEIPDFSPDELHVNLLHISRHYYGNETSERADRASLEKALARVRELRPFSLHPVALLEKLYHRHALTWLETGRTPLPCHALASSVFVDSWGNVRPCSIYDAPLGSLRDHDLSLEKLYDATRAREMAREIRQGKCPQCWTPCEAYQTILGNLLPRPFRRKSAASVPSCEAASRTLAPGPRG